MSEEEAFVIECAIEFMHTWDHGFFKDRKRAIDGLRSAIDSLQAEHDGQWRNPL